jgi:hypothetical protein
MSIEPLDYKSECVSIYYDGKLIEDVPNEQVISWSYHSVFENNKDTLYASLYCGGKTIDEVCPEHLKSNWKSLNNKMKAYFRSFAIAKINLNHNCIFDMIPDRFLIEYYGAKSQISDWVVHNYQKPKDYDYLFELAKVAYTIKNQKLNIDTTPLLKDVANPLTKKAIVKYNNIEPYIKYDIFGSKTGRLSTINSSFPILNMNKEHRCVLTPSNDWFVELDYNGAELRTFLALANEQQPDCDIHEWNAKNIFNDFSREEAKTAILAWLYGETKNNKAEQIYKKEEVLNKYWDGSTVKTIYGMEIEADRKHAINYLIQSTFAQLSLRQMIKVFNFLKDKKSFIAFTVHDNIVIDLAEEDKKDLKQVMNIYSETDLGKFKVNLKVGSNYGYLKKI